MARSTALLDMTLTVKDSSQSLILCETYICPDSRVIPYDIEKKESYLGNQFLCALRFDLE